MSINIPAFGNTRILVVGDIMFDRYWYGDTSRVSPEAPVPVVHVGDTEERPGGAANVALNIASLGVQVALLGVTGDDEAAGLLETKLSGAGVECIFQKIPGVSTISKLRIISRHQQLIRLDFEDDFQLVDSALLLDRFSGVIGTSDAVVISDYGKGTLRHIEALIAVALKSGKPVFVDPKADSFSRYRGASMITPNLAELERVVGPCVDEAVLVEKGNALIDQLELDALLVTRGEHGMTLLEKNASEVHFPTQAREVFDVTGAGDTVIAVLAASIVAGEGFTSAAALANLAAGIVVGKLGTACVSVPELSSSATTAQTPGCGDVSAEQLKVMVEDARTRGERIVMTNGCFDILHAGHVAYLDAAKRMGDRLVVAVNDDDSVRRLKGNGRPVNSLERRMTVLGALGCVDWVVPFSEDTPGQLICDIGPDLLVKGGDYRPEEIAGHDCVRKNGGEVIVLDYADGCSTSDIIKAIQQQEST